MSQAKLLKLSGCVIFISFAFFLISRSEAMASSAVCEEPKNVRITEKEFIYQGDRLSNVRKMVLRSASENAVAKVTGRNLHAFSKMQESQRGNEISSNFESESLEAIQGRIVNQKILDEQVIVRGKDRMLRLVVSFDVCDKRNSRIIVSIGEVTINNRPQQRARSLLLSNFPTNEILSVSPHQPGRGYKDYTVSGVVEWNLSERITQAQSVNQSGQQGGVGVALIGALAGAALGGRRHRGGAALVGGFLALAASGAANQPTQIVNKKIFSYGTRVNLKAINEMSLQSFNYSGEGFGSLEDESIVRQKLWRDTGGLIQVGANFLAEKIYVDEAHRRGKVGSAFSRLSSGFLQPQTSTAEAGCGGLPHCAN